MVFQKLDEDLLIEHLTQLFSKNHQVVGIGDDCAVIPAENAQAWLVTTDALVEGVHFLKEQIKAEDLGYKTVAVNVSDIAAMGGQPKYAFLSIALPKTADEAWIYLLMNGIKEACDKWGILLLGGDTVGSNRDVFINLTLVGSAKQDKIKYRDQACVGDILCVNGYLGDSGGGLKALRESTHRTDDIEHLIHSHFHPKPSTEQGMWLADHQEVHAMMDISDGLHCDVKKLIKRSKKGALIETTQIPISNFLSRVCIKENWDPLQLAMTGGEDYCLLFTVATEAFENINTRFEKIFNSSLFPIGTIIDQTDKLIYQKRGKKIQMDHASYDHFQ